MLARCSTDQAKQLSLATSCYCFARTAPLPLRGWADPLSSESCPLSVQEERPFTAAMVHVLTGPQRGTPNHKGENGNSAPRLTAGDRRDRGQNGDDDDGCDEQSTPTKSHLERKGGLGRFEGGREGGNKRKGPSR